MFSLATTKVSLNFMALRIGSQSRGHCRTDLSDGNVCDRMAVIQEPDFLLSTVLSKFSVRIICLILSE